MELPKIKTLDEAERMKDDLIERQVDIQQQLGDKNRCHQDGTRYTAQEYWEWRKKASYALKCIVKELRFVKTWIRNHENMSGKYKDKKDTSMKVLEQCEKAIDLFIEYKSKELPDTDAKLAAIDELTLQLGLVDLSNAGEPR
jgi:hypothetical protein